MTPSTELRNALPSAWVDKLFVRLAALYGRHWLEMWADVPMADVKDAWASGLAGRTGEELAAGLAKLGKFPPTLPEFMEFCRVDPIPQAQREWKGLAAPKTSPSAEVAALLANFGKPKADPKRWAREILEMAEDGTYRLPIGIAFAKLALDGDLEDAAGMERRGPPMDVHCSTFLEFGTGEQAKVMKVRL